VCGFYDNWTYRDGGNVPQCREGGMFPQTDKARLFSVHLLASKDSYHDDVFGSGWLAVLSIFACHLLC